MGKLFFIVRLLVVVLLLETTVIRAEHCNCDVLTDIVSEEILDRKIENKKLTARIEALELKLSERESVSVKDTDQYALEKMATLADSEMENTNKFKTDHRALRNLLVKSMSVEKLKRLQLEIRIEKGLERINSSITEINEHIKSNFESQVNNFSHFIEEFKNQSFESEAKFRYDVMYIAHGLENQTNELLNDRKAVETTIEGINQNVSRMDAKFRKDMMNMFDKLEKQTRDLVNVTTLRTTIDGIDKDVSRMDAKFRNDIENVFEKLKNQTNNLVNVKTFETTTDGINKDISRIDAEFRNDIINVFEKLENQAKDLVNVRTLETTTDGIKQDISRMDAEFRNDIANVFEKLENQAKDLVNVRTLQTTIDGINQDVSRMAADISSVVDIILLDQKAVCEPNCNNGGVCFMDGSCRCKPLTEGSRCEKFICQDKCFENDGECVGPGICKCPQGWKGKNCEHFVCHDKCFENKGECVGPGLCKCPPELHGYNCEHQVTDCYDIKEAQSHLESGMYQVLLKGSDVPVDVLCDMETDGGGWTIFQNRFDGSVDFYRKFTEYVNGFGEVNGEFWLGLENIYRLISHGQSELRIDMSRANGRKGYTTYREFSLSAGPDYELRISHETAGDLTYGYNDRYGLYRNNGALFSTYDRDRDTWDSGNCASDKKGGWWYRDCTNVNLNGRYCTPGTYCGAKGMYYDQFAVWESLKTSRMMVRRHHSNK